MALLQTRGINIGFLGIQVLFDVDFDLLAGEIHCLCGENGAGKSTLVKILTGIKTHYTGQVFIEGAPVRLSSARVAREAGIFAVQQHRDLVPTLSAAENIFLGSEVLRGKSRERLDFAAMKEKAGALIGRFDVDIDLERPVGELRVSEQGIVAICKAIAAEGRVLLIDEASAPLDNTERQTLYRILEQLRDEGRGIMYISHHLEEIFRIGQRVTVLRNGQKVCTVPVGSIDAGGLIEAMTGQRKMYERAEGSSAAPDSEGPVLEFRGVSSAGLSDAGASSAGLQDVSFQLRRGEILGIAGLEGSSKDEIARIAFGLSPQGEGEVLLRGKLFRPSNPLDAVKQGIGLVPTDRKNAGLVLCRSVGENVILAAVNRAARFLVSPRWVRRTAQEGIRRLDIRTSGPAQLVEYLSGGNQQKVLLSKWLEAEADVLLLVEPTEGIDVGTRAELYAMFKSLAREGKALLVFTNDIDELMVLCDRILAMVDGAVVGEYRAGGAEKNRILADILSTRERAATHV
jgi:ribose transport system ATP-binding protein